MYLYWSSKIQPLNFTKWKTGYFCHGSFLVNCYVYNFSKKTFYYFSCIYFKMKTFLSYRFHSPCITLNSNWNFFFLFYDDVYLIRSQKIGKKNCLTICSTDYLERHCSTYLTPAKFTSLVFI